MTLEELAHAAEALIADGIPGDTLVHTEGCDCAGPASILRYERAGTVVVLERASSPHRPRLGFE